ncbi:hypothetical protein, partial [Treponema phagedenis]|uniref:hypothetical protein n=1 Tax=Treponema phagedenis TaxID=162 RepID=UPI001C070417
KWVGAGVYVGNENTFYKSNKDEVDMSIYAKFETKGDKKKANFLVENLMQVLRYTYTIFFLNRYLLRLCL